MKIVVTFKDQPTRVFETSGDSMISSDVSATSAETKRLGRIGQVQLRPRLDLLNVPGTGLMVEIWLYSTTPYENEEPVQSSVFNSIPSSESLPNMRLVPGYLWHLIPYEELGGVVSIDIDNCIHVERIRNQLLDLTAYRAIEKRVLSQAERNSCPLDNRVTLVHDRMRTLYEGMTDDDVAAEYGLDMTLFEYATESMKRRRDVAFDNNAEDGTQQDVDANDGQVDYDDDVLGMFDELADLADEGSIVDCVAGILRRCDGMSFNSFVKEARRHDVMIDDMRSIWKDACLLRDGDEDAVHAHLLRNGNVSFEASFDEEDGF